MGKDDSKMKVLYAASEAVPLIASGGLADVAGALPKAIRNRRVACRVVLPLYQDIKQEYRDKFKYVTNFYVDVSWRKQYCGLFEYNHNGVIYYLLDNEYYFKRPGLYGYYDDAERFAFFSRAILEMLKYIDYKPDIIHTNDWQTALVPIYYKLFYQYAEGYDNIRHIFTIHNIQYQGKYGLELMEPVLGIASNQASILECDGCVNLMKGAIQVADKVTTVSPSYANEILTPWYSHGLDPILNMNRYKLCGILNGIDNSRFDPKTDEEIYANFTANDLSGKQENKKKLLEEFGLEDDGSPVISMVTRLVDHKGVDLVRAVFDDIIAEGFKVVVLGSGEKEYEDFFNYMKGKYPDRIGLYIGFVPPLAKKIYASSDMFLMPSKSEPCGLAQMISLRYGTVPIVRETGGLRDTIFDCGSLSGNGFTFKTYQAYDMLDAIRRAKALYYDQENWQGLVKYAMGCDNSWKRSAASYVAMYNEVAGVAEPAKEE
jgi:starch synthase